MKPFTNFCEQKGFTLIEVVLSVAIISLLASFSIPVYQSFQIKNGVDVAAMTVAQTLRRAQLLSQSMEEDDGWGVTVAAGSVTLFKGTSVGSEYDEVFTISNGITVGGVTTFVFSKATGIPQTP